MNSPHNPIVAISSEFMNAFAAIPKKQQGKVLEFITKFRANPTASSINYEKIIQFKDHTLRSVRIDQTYRGIVKKPDTGNVYMLLWVDHHDKAYDWARNKKCTINPETGSLQVYDVDDTRLTAAEKEVSHPDPEKTCLFAAIHDRHLIKLGVPEELLPLARTITSDEELDGVVDQFPVEAQEALIALAAGYTLDDVFREFDRDTGEQQHVDPDDYEQALKNPDSKRHFVVVEDDLELQEVLEAPLEKWRVFLHPSQRNLVERNWNGPVRVLGGAGTGKTVVAMHRAKWLAEQIFTGEHDRILFTTFTRNLAADIKENLAKICPVDLLHRIEVVNLDRCVSGFLQKNAYDYQIDYGSRTGKLWEQAVALASAELGLAESFYRDEWERVIQPQGLSSFDEYLTASRVGRGTRLSRKHRKDVWPVFEEYRLLLNEHNLREVEDALRDARAILSEKGDILPYRAIIVDEAQDMGTQAFRLIREMIPGGEQKNDLFIVGDAHQRIYRHKVVLGQCGINIRGRGKKLRINYRTTEENRRWAVTLLKGLSFDDLDGEQDDQQGYRSLIHGLRPRIECATSFQDEIRIITQFLEKLKDETGSLKDVCLVARTNDLLHQYEGALKANGYETHQISRDKADDRSKKGVRLATMHRVKGLEFDQMIIAGVNHGIVPINPHFYKTDDAVIMRENEVHERALLYVAVTRAKKEVLITSFGKCSKFLSPEITEK